MTKPSAKQKNMKRAPAAKTTPVKPDATDWPRVRALKDQDIAHDAESPRTTAADWDGAVMKQAGRHVGTVRRRGPNKTPTKVSTTLRLPRETLERWKATGPGWQTRMAEALSKAL